MRALPDRVLVVTDLGQAGGKLAQAIDQVLAAGGRWIWFRDRHLADAGRAGLARALLGQLRPFGATLTIGADIGLAQAIGAGGVHLPAAALAGEARRRLGAGTPIGVSAHSLADVEEAARAGADYATLSPIFASPSKPGYGPPLGLGPLSRAARLSIPVLALGGVSPANARACMEAGAAGIAVMGAVVGAERPAAVYRRLAEAANLKVACS